MPDTNIIILAAVAGCSAVTLIISILTLSKAKKAADKQVAREEMENIAIQAAIQAETDDLNRIITDRADSKLFFFAIRICCSVFRAFQHAFLRAQ